MVKNLCLPMNARTAGLHSLTEKVWVRKIPWKREWQPTAVLLPGESPGQRNLESCRLWGHKESDTTQLLTLAHKGKDYFQHLGQCLAHRWCSIKIC